LIQQPTSSLKSTFQANQGMTTEAISNIETAVVNDKNEKILNQVEEREKIK